LVKTDIHLHGEAVFMNIFRNPPDVHPPLGAYSHQVEIGRPERLVALSGQVGVREDGSVPTDPVDQLDAALENVTRNLRAAHMAVEDIIKITYYLVGPVDTERRREVILARFKDHRPCSTLLFVAALASPAYKVEIDVWAARAGQGDG
jgi:enamine deaminase RidA (YjgF/YER057c/UK114 family)